MNPELREQSEPSKQGNGEPAEKTNQPAQGIPPSISCKSGFPPDVIPPGKSDEKTNNGANPINDNPPNWCEVLTLFIEVVGLFGLGFYCFYTFKEWKTFDSERVTMDKELKEIHDEHVLDQRPWIGVYAVEFHADEDGGFARLKIKNAGKTPAINMLCTVGKYWNERDIPQTDIKNVSPHYAGTAYPDTEGFIPGPHINAREIHGIQSGTNCFILGTLWYDDIFKHQHWTQFCFRIAADFSASGMAIHNSCDGEN